jgi:periplasmic protein TonB
MMIRLSAAAPIVAFIAMFALTVSAQGEVYKPGNGVTLPQVVREVKPVYTREAKEARISGTVLIRAVVESDGKVGDVQVTRSLDKEYGLDDQAVKAARQWEFKPGTKDGKPVAVEITLEMTFTLK